MPELPEVETVVRSVRPHLVGRRIANLEILAPRILHGSIEPTGAAGQRVLSVSRRAKHILIELDRGVLLIHLGMTGKLLWNAPETKWTRAIVTLDKGRLVYDDPRMFGRIEYSPGSAPERIARLGPEPLALSLEQFLARLKSRRTRLKPLLLDQSFLAGLGNIYADESLFRARLHPLAIASRLSPTRAARLFDAIREVLSAAIESGGSSISDYVDAAGQPGWFQVMHRVYGRAGEPCTACSTAVRRIVLGGRSTHYCPRCQRI
jgi:formamidopyrimidine-DNA glycosylase